jgi:hypothetical protein
MIRLPKLILPYATCALALGVVILASPRAAHAIVATLVQVTNTTANPAITQSVPSQASQLVSLYASAGLGNEIGVTNYLAFVVEAAVSQGAYSVPAGQSLVITDIDTIPSCGGAFQLALAPSLGGGIGQTVANLYMQGPVTPHLEYRSGIVFPPGSVPAMQLYGCQQTGIYLHGYLTSN